MTFKIDPSAYTFTTLEQQSAFFALLRNLHTSLFFDSHLRASFYPVWKGNGAALFSNAKSEEQHKFSKHFDDFLLNHLPIVALVRIDRSGFTYRPSQAGDKIKIHINNELVSATSIALSSRPRPQNVSLLKLTTICTINHELAHSFAAFCQHVDSPLALSVSGGMNPVIERGAKEQVIRDDNEKAGIKSIGYVQEAHFFGRSGKLTISVEKRWNNEWNKLSFLLLDTETGMFKIPIEETHAASYRLLDCQSDTIDVEQDAYIPPLNTIQLRVAELTTGTDSPTAPPPPSRAEGQMIVIGLFGPVTGQSASSAPPELDHAG